MSHKVIRREVVLTCGRPYLLRANSDKFFCELSFNLGILYMLYNVRILSGQFSEQTSLSQDIEHFHHPENSLVPFPVNCATPEINDNMIAIDRV